MINTTSSTRVKAPATRDPDPLHVSNETYDGQSLNPLGRDAPDRSGLGSHKLLKCKKASVFSTFNVRTLNPMSRFHELTSIAQNCSVDIISIQEHRKFHPDSDLEYSLQDGFQLVTASATKNTVNHEIINLEMTPKKGGCAETSNHICGHMFTNLKYFNIVSLGNVRYVIGN